MRRVVLKGPFDLRLEESEVPVPPAAHVLVRVEAAGVCGSDLHGYRGVNARRTPGTVMGHEVSGTVEQVGPGVEPSWAGQAVAVNPILGCEVCAACRAGQPQRCPEKSLIGCTPRHHGGFADYLLAPVTAVVPWSGPAPLAWAAFAEPLAVGLHAVRNVLVANREVLVIGSGAVAVAVALSARQAGSRVTVTSGDARRSLTLTELGLSPGDAASVAGGAPFDVVVDCVADDESVNLAMRHCGICGTVVMVGLGAPVLAVPVESLVQRDLVVRGSAQYSRASFAQAVTWLSSGRLDITQLIERRPLVEAPALFRAWGDDSERPVRTLLIPG